MEASIAADAGDVKDELDWTNAVVGLPPRKKDIHIRIDSDVLDWFKQSGGGYQTRMNSVLRAFVQSRQRIGSSNIIRRKLKRVKHAT